MSTQATYSDLTMRIVTALGLVTLVAVAMALGDMGVLVLMSVFSSIILWEVATMVRVPAPLMWSAVFGAVVFMSGVMEFPLAAWAALVLGAVAAVRFSSVLSVCLLAIGLTVYTYATALRSDPMVFLWIVTTVVATDIGGYFCGRFIGGPKVAPKLSPKKTWAGVIGGWCAAIAVSMLFSLPIMSLGQVVIATLIVSVFSQVGDFSQSALKRRCGVKDSSSLLPGHGGFFDRCDGLIGAGVVASPIVYLFASVA